MKMIHMQCPGHPEATLEGYILDCEIKLGQNVNRPDASDRVTYTPTFASIIDDVPLLKRRISTGVTFPSSVWKFLPRGVTDV